MEADVSKDHSKSHVDCLEDLFQGCITARHSNEVDVWFKLLRDLVSVLVTEMKKDEEEKFNKDIRDFLPRINELKSGSDLDMVSSVDIDLFMALKEWEDSLRKIRKRAGLQQSVVTDSERVA